MACYVFLIFTSEFTYYGPNSYLLLVRGAAGGDTTAHMSGFPNDEDGGDGGGDDSNENDDNNGRGGGVGDGSGGVSVLLLINFKCCLRRSFIKPRLFRNRHRRIEYKRA